MKRKLSAILLALLLLGGCTGRAPFSPPWEDGGGEGMAVYRLAVPGEKGTPDGTLLGVEHISPPEDGGSPIEAALALVAAPSGVEGLRCALPDGVTVADWSQDRGAVTVTFSDSFLDLEGMDRTAAAFCTALTLCALEGVDAVTIAAGGQTLFSNLTAADALLRDTDTDPYVRQLRLYFADGDGRYLVSEYHSLTLDEDASAERYVMEELLRGPNSAELESPIPAGTRLLSCRTEDGVCTVDLSAEFCDARPRTALGERLAVYSIVDSLTLLSQVESVSILVEGAPVEEYVYLSLDQPLVRYEGAVGPAAEGELDTDLYLPLPGLRAITPLPWRVTVGERQSAPEAVLSALLTAAEPGYPALFSGSGTVGSVTSRQDICTVDLSESFFASLPPEARGTAVQSMAASLCALDSIDKVFFTIGGRPALFDGVDWSGPWESFDLVQ